MPETTKLHPKQPVAAALASRAAVRPALRQGGAFALGLAGGWAVLYGALLPLGLGLTLGLPADCFAACAAGAALSILFHGFGAFSLDSLCLLCAVGIGVLLGGGAFLGGNLLLHFYSTDEAVVAAGLARMRIICTTYFLCGVMDTLASCLRGRGYSVMPMIVSLVGSCLLRLVWIATVFQLFRSPTTLYISYPISWILTALVHFICLMAVRKKLHAESSAMAA